MPLVTVSENLDSVESGFKALPPGEYLVKCSMPKDKDDNGNVLKSKKGDAMIKFLAEVMEPASMVNAAGEDEITKGRNFFVNLMLEGKGLGITKSFLEAAGVPWEGNTFNTDLIAGAMLRFKNELGLYDGKPSNNVKGYSPQ